MRFKRLEAGADAAVAAEDTTEVPAITPCPIPSATLEALLKLEDWLVDGEGDEYREDAADRLACLVNKPAATECLELLRSRDE